MSIESEESVVNRGFVIPVLIAVAVVAAIILVIWKIQPSFEEQKQIVMEGAVREDSPAFAEMTKRIIAENDPEKTWESPVGTGTIMMNIAGRIKNYSGKTINGLEIKVSVLDSFKKPVKEKTLIIVPTQQSTLPPGGTMDVVVRMEGFAQDDDRARIQWKVTAIKTE